MSVLSPSEDLITIRLPDGGERQFTGSVTGTEIATGISKSLGKKAIAIAVDGKVMDLSTRLEADAGVRILTRDDEEALELIRHDCAHVLAEAVQELFPGTQVTIGPAIENGFYYDFARDEPFTPEDFEAIEAKMREVIQRKAPFVRSEWDRDKAIEFFRAKGEAYKVELIQDLPESEIISLYSQGDWIDLCRGPHMPTTEHVGDGFKLLKIAGAYWRGDHRNAMLQRIYGTAWRNKKELDAHLTMLEEAEKRDHRRLGQKMDLFHFQPEAQGSVFWHARGWTLYTLLISYMRERQERAGYREINTPDMMDQSLWLRSGHWEKFGENMFSTTLPDERTLCLKPMSCPGAVETFRQGIKSYRDLPLRLSEFGKVHRYEPHGALHGLMRLRSFTQDDAHIFCTQEQITEECVVVVDLILSIYRDFGFEDVRIKFSDRPEKRIGSDEVWDRAEAALKHSVEAAGQAVTLNPGEGAFYGPKLEFVLRDAIGRDWQCGTLQVDFNLPERLGASFIDTDGERKIPVMLHRALFGSIERFSGILLENYAGNLPLWLAPVQVVVATITDESAPYAQEVTEALKAKGLRVEADLRNEKISFKVRDLSEQKIPVIIAVGKREAEERSVAIRRLGSKEQSFMSLDEALTALATEGSSPLDR